MSATTAFMSEFVLGSIFAFTNSPPSAKLSFKRPQSPLGSAAVMAIPAIVTLSRRTFHSSGVKFDLSVMSATPLALGNAPLLAHDLCRTEGLFQPPVRCQWLTIATRKD